MGFAGYVPVCVQLYCFGFHRLSLHVSAYMTIFKCVGYFIFIYSTEQTNNKEKASRHTRKERTKITKENGTEKTQMETCRV
jgi:hypothetical protein